MKKKAMAAVTGTATALPLLLLAAPASADSHYQQFTTTDQYYSYDLPCLGEDVLITQTQHTLYDPTSIDSITEIHGTAVGQATGATYQLNVTDHERLTPSPDGWIFTIRARWVGSGTAPNWYNLYTGRLVYNSDGSYTITYSFQDSCVQAPS